MINAIEELTPEERAARFYRGIDDPRNREQVRIAAAKLLENEGSEKAECLVRGARRRALRIAKESSGKETEIAENAALFHGEVLRVLEELSGGVP